MAKKTPLDKDKVFTGVLFILLGAAIATLICVLIAAHEPTGTYKCSDGWTIEERDNQLIKTYVEENDTCKKGI